MPPRFAYGRRLAASIVVIAFYLGATVAMSPLTLRHFDETGMIGLVDGPPGVGDHIAASQGDAMDVEAIAAVVTWASRLVHLRFGGQCVT